MNTAPDACKAYQPRPLGVQINLSHCVLCTLTVQNVHWVVPEGINSALNSDLVQPTGKAPIADSVLFLNANLAPMNCLPFSPISSLPEPILKIGNASSSRLVPKNTTRPTVKVYRERNGLQKTALPC